MSDRLQKVLAGDSNDHPCFFLKPKELSLPITGAGNISNNTGYVIEQDNERFIKYLFEKLGETEAKEIIKLLSNI